MQTEEEGDYLLKKSASGRLIPSNTCNESDHVMSFWDSYLSPQNTAIEHKILMAAPCPFKGLFNMLKEHIVYSQYTKHIYNKSF